MSMISRYKKSGGFVQLINLIETCGPAKREKFLSIIESENKNWSDALKRKMLTLDRIFTWDDNTLGEVAIRINELTLATAFHGLDEERRNRLTATFSHAQRRRITDLFESKAPNPNEISATFVKIIQEVRNMISLGQLRMDKIDPGLLIHDDIEADLNQAYPLLMDEEPVSPINDDSSQETEALFQEPSKTAPNAKGPDMEAIKTKVIQLNRENQNLKKENHVLKEKLEQIKKIC